VDELDDLDDLDELDYDISVFCPIRPSSPVRPVRQYSNRSRLCGAVLLKWIKIIGSFVMSNYWEMILALILYFSALTTLVVWSSRKVHSSSDFIIGNRSLNFWLTAMAAHASDMSSWLFMGYPALIFVGGLFNCWVAVGLVFFMWLNWLFVAPRLRTLTGNWNCSTFSSFLHYRYRDESGVLQLSSALFCFLFYSVYICAFLTGLGILGQTLFGLSYSLSILIGTAIVVGYVTMGGFITLAWIDLVQGLFLLGVIFLVPHALHSGAKTQSSCLYHWRNH